MIFYFAAIIITCVKEIFSWNCILLSAVYFIFSVTLSYQYTDGKILNEHSSSSKDIYIDSVITSNSSVADLQSVKQLVSFNSPTELEQVGQGIGMYSSLKPSADNVTSATVSATTLFLGYPFTNNSRIIDYPNVSQPVQNNFANLSSMMTVTTIKTTEIISEQHGNLNTEKQLQPSTTLVPAISSTINYISTVEPQKNLSNSTVIIPSTAIENANISRYVLAAICILIIIAIIVYTIYHFYRKEQVRRLRLQLMPVYNFDPTESDDWENNLLEEEYVTLRSGGSKRPSAVGVAASPNNATNSCQKSNVPVTYL